MQNRKTAFSLMALLGAAVAAPGLSVVVALAIALLISAATGHAGAMGGLLFSPFILLQIVIATVLGFPSALAFGGGGAFCAGRLLSLRARWPWALAGGASAAAYVLTSVVLALWRSGIAVWTAPWLIFLGVDDQAGGQPYDVASLVVVTGGIILAGGLAGMIYHFALTRSQVVWRTYSPLAAEREGFKPVIDEEG